MIEFVQKLRAGLVAVLMVVPVSVAFAAAPPTPLPPSVLCNTCTASLALTSTSARVALPSTNPSYNALTVVNLGTKDAWIIVGDSTATATSAGILIPAGQTVGNIWLNGTYVAGITAGADTTTLKLYQSNGLLSFKTKAFTGSATPSGPAGGDLSGTYPDPSVVSYNGGTAFGSAAAASIGTSGNTVPKNNTANIYSALQTVNLNTAAATAPITGTTLNLNAADSAIGRVQVNSYGAISAFTAARANGTAASPTSVLANDQIGGFNGYAWGSGALQGSIGSFRIYANENITSTAWGSRGCIGAIPNLSTTMVDVACFNGSGAATITGSLAIGGATIGANALAVTGAANITGAIVGGGGISTTGGVGFRFTSRSIIDSSADGLIRLTNNAATDFGLLQLGGTTSSFPALKRSGTGLQVRLADDSGYADFVANQLIGANINLTGSAIPTNGVYLPVGNVIGVATSSTLRGLFNSAGFSSNTSGSFQVAWAASSATIPTVRPNSSDTTSGLGGAASVPAMIVGSATKQNWEATKSTFTVPVADLITTFGALPSAATIGQGYRAFITDALTPTFGAAAVGGGAVKVPVFSDGTNWIVGANDNIKQTEMAA